MENLSTGLSHVEGPVIVDPTFTKGLALDLLKYPTDIAGEIVSNSNLHLASHENIYDLKTWFKPITYSNLVTKENMNGTFISLQKWEGYISKLDHTSGSFIAIVTSLSYGEGQKETGTIEFDFEEVNPGDLDLVKDGAIFYWNIGYQYSGGVRTKSSLIRFRRFPRWKSKTFDAVSEKAKENLRSISWK